MPAACCDLCGTMGDDGLNVDSTTRGSWQGSRAMQVTFVLGLDFGPLQVGCGGSARAHDYWPVGMTFIGSAAALKRAWNNIEGTLANAGHRLRGYKCGVWAPGFEQFEDAEPRPESRTQEARRKPPWL